MTKSPMGTIEEKERGACCARLSSQCETDDDQPESDVTYTEPGRQSDIGHM